MLGAGPDLLLAPGFVTHLDLMWGLPPFEAMLKLGRIFRVIVLDKRGTGLSDRCLWGRRGGWCPITGFISPTL